MCLIVQDNTPLIAKEDIECYKIVYKTSADKYWRTLYMEYHITKYGKVYNNTQRVHIHKDVFEDYRIEGGCYHTFANETEAVEYALRSWVEDFLCRPDMRCVVKCVGIAKAIIPKGSEYYKGEYGASDCYASRAIIYNKPKVINHLFKKK